MSIELIKTKDRVQRILSLMEYSRDDDNILIHYMWIEDLINKGLDYKYITAYRFFEMLAHGELTSPESIRRVRQKLQEQNEDLRGYKYKKRIENQERIKQQLKEIESL